MNGYMSLTRRRAFSMIYLLILVISPVGTPAALASNLPADYFKNPFRDTINRNPYRLSNNPRVRDSSTSNNSSKHAGSCQAVVITSNNRPEVCWRSNRWQRPRDQAITASADLLSNQRNFYNGKYLLFQ